MWVLSTIGGVSAAPQTSNQLLEEWQRRVKVKVKSHQSWGWALLSFEFEVSISIKQTRIQKSHIGHDVYLLLVLIKYYSYLVVSSLLLVNKITQSSYFPATTGGVLWVQKFCRQEQEFPGCFSQCRNLGAGISSCSLYGVLWWRLRNIPSFMPPSKV